MVSFVSFFIFGWGSLAMGVDWIHSVSRSNLDELFVLLKIAIKTSPVVIGIIISQKV
jgi:hypothetical protein